MSMYVITSSIHQPKAITCSRVLSTAAVAGVLGFMTLKLLIFYPDIKVLQDACL